MNKGVKEWNGLGGGGGYEGSVGAGFSNGPFGSFNYDFTIPQR